MKEAYLISKERIEHNVEIRVRAGVKVVLEESLTDVMAEHLKAGYRQRTPTRRDECNGHYQRNLVTPMDKSTSPSSSFSRPIIAHGGPNNRVCYSGSYARATTLAFAQPYDRLRENRSDATTSVAFFTTAMNIRRQAWR